MIPVTLWRTCSRIGSIQCRCLCRAAKYRGRRIAARTFHNIRRHKQFTRLEWRDDHASTRLAFHLATFEFNSICLVGRCSCPIGLHGISIHRQRSFYKLGRCNECTLRGRLLHLGTKMHIDLQCRISVVM